MHEFDRVVFTQSVDGWPAGTQATVVDIIDSAGTKLIVDLDDATPGIDSGLPDDRLVQVSASQVRTTRTSRATTTG